VGLVKSGSGLSIWSGSDLGLVRSGLVRSGSVQHWFCIVYLVWVLSGFELGLVRSRYDHVGVWSGSGSGLSIWSCSGLGIIWVWSGLGLITAGSGQVLVCLSGMDLGLKMPGLVCQIRSNLVGVLPSLVTVCSGLWLFCVRSGLSFHQFCLN